MDVLVFSAIAGGYAVVVLLLTRRFTGAALLAGLVLALVPAAALMVFLPGESTVRTLSLPMTSGATFAGVVRALRGWETPLGRADRA